MLSVIEDFIVSNGVLIGGVISGVVLASVSSRVMTWGKKFISWVSNLKTQVSKDLAVKAARSKVDVLALETRVQVLETATANAVQNLHDRLMTLETTVIPASALAVPVATPVEPPHVG